MMKISKWLVGLAAFGFALGAVSAPYSVTYTDTANASVSDIIGNEQATVKFVFDNGNSSVANQAWTAFDVQCVIFTFNNAQNKYVAFNYSGKPFTDFTLGNFTTNGAGQLQSGTFEWFDDPITNPYVTNITGATGFYDWVINHYNDVLFWGGSNGVGFNNVLNDDQFTNWSNPVPANGVCAGYFPPISIPTLSEWGKLILSMLLVLVAAFSLRLQRP
jgi:hypothetical protein